VRVNHQRPLDLARLAADERTPEHERAAAAMALAKLVARDGMPASRSEWPSGGATTSYAMADLERQNQALADILEHNSAELRQLRAEKRELEERLRLALVGARSA